MLATFEHVGSLMSATIVNIGLGGAFIAAGTIPGYGEGVLLVVELPGSRRSSRLPAVVRWTSPVGFGVQFRELGARETYAISQLVASHPGSKNGEGDSTRSSRVTTIPPPP